MAREGGGATNYLASSTSLGCPFTDYPFTISMWFYHINNSNGTFMSYSYSSATNYTGFNTFNNALSLYTDSSSDYISTAFAGGTKWYYVALSALSSTSRRIRVDGGVTNFTASRPIPSNLNRYGLFAYLDFTVSDYMPSGNYVSDLAIWNTNLSDDETALLYTKSASPLMIRPQNLVAYCPLNDGAGSARDIIGGRHLNEIGTIPLVDNPPLRYPRRSFSGFIPGTPPTPPPSPTYDSLFVTNNF